MLSAMDGRGEGRPLPARRVRALRAVAEAAFSSEAGPPPAARLDWLMADVGDFLVRAGWRLRAVVFSSLLVCTFVAPLLLRRRPPLRRLPPAERLAALERLERSRFAMPLFAVKALLALMYYEAPGAPAEAGYDPECQA